MDEDYMNFSGWSMLDDSSHLFTSQENIFHEASLAEKGRESGSPDCFLSSSLDVALEEIEKEKENGMSLWADIKLLHLDLSHDMEEIKSQLNFLREMLSNLKDEIRSVAKDNGLQHMAVPVRMFGHLDHAKSTQNK